MKKKSTFRSEFNLISFSELTCIIIIIVVIFIIKNKWIKNKKKPNNKSTKMKCYVHRYVLLYIVKYIVTVNNANLTPRFNWL